MVTKYEGESLVIFFSALYDVTDSITYIKEEDLEISMIAADIEDIKSLYEWINKSDDYGYIVNGSEDMRYYFYKGKLHREDGPACESYNNGSKPNQYWICGNELSEEEFKKL